MCSSSNPYIMRVDVCVLLVGANNFRIEIWGGMVWSARIMSLINLFGLKSWIQYWPLPLRKPFKTRIGIWTSYCIKHSCIWRSSFVREVVSEPRTLRFNEKRCIWELAYGSPSAEIWFFRLTSRCMVLNLRRYGAFPILALGRIKDFAEGSTTGTSLSTTTVS